MLRYALVEKWCQPTHFNNLFQHVVLILTGILAYAIPDVPLVIKEHLAYEEQQMIDARANLNNR